MSLRPIGMPCSGPRQLPAVISASAARAAARAGSRSTRMKLLSLPLSRSMRARRLSTSSTGESSRLAISVLASAIVRKSGITPSYPRRREDMSGLGAHRALPPHPFCHLLDEMDRGGDLQPLVLRHIEAGAGEPGLDLGARHALRFHDAVPHALAARIGTGDEPSRIRASFCRKLPRGGTGYLAANAHCAAIARV